MKSVVKFIRGHQYSLHLWRKHANHELLLPVETRFATEFIMGQRLVDEQSAAQEMVADRHYGQWLNGSLEAKKTQTKKYKTEGMRVKGMINNDDWWATGALIMEIVTPIIQLLRHADSELPIMGKVYARMGAIAAKLEDPEFAKGVTASQRRDIIKVHTVRWNYLHTYYHAAGYCLDPEFVGDAQHTVAHVMVGFHTVCDRLFYDQSEKAARAKEQLTVFRHRSLGIFGQPGTWAHARTMPAHEWWEMYGAGIPELQYVAMRVLSKRSSACAVERLWSLFGRVWSDERARLGPAKAVELVRAGANLRLKEKLLMSDYEKDMRSWLEGNEPEESDDDASDDGMDDEDGATAQGAAADGPPAGARAADGARAAT